MSLLRTLDPGTMGGDTGRPVFLALMLIVTVGGIFIVSALIGVLTTGLNKRIDRLRKGRSRLIERGHTIVLGWSDQVFTVIEELVEANQSERRSCVVVLADRDKVEMEDQIRDRVADTGRTPDSYEFQLLYGIRPEEQARLAAAGHTVRAYVPYGADWYGYFMRRLAERPANLQFFLRSLATKS